MLYFFPIIQHLSSLITTGDFKSIEKGTNPQLRRNPPSLRPPPWCLHLWRQLTYNHEHSRFFSTSHPELGNNEFLTPKGPYITKREAPKPQFCLIDDWQEITSLEPPVTTGFRITQVKRAAGLLNPYAAPQAFSRHNRILQWTLKAAKNPSARNPPSPPPDRPTNRGAHIQVPTHFLVQHRTTPLRQYIVSKHATRPRGQNPVRWSVHSVNLGSCREIAEQRVRTGL